MFLIFFASCNQHSGMTTIINSDGSCNREISLHVGKQQLVSGISDEDNIVRLSKGYALSWTLEGDSVQHSFPLSQATYDSLQAAQGDTVWQKVTVHACAKYNNVEEMARRTLLTPDSMRIQPQARLEKKFRWFRTIYRFTETYPQQKITFLVKPEKYISTEEIGYWTKGEPNLAEGLSGREADALADSIKQKLSNLLLANYFEALYQTTLNHYGELRGAPKDREAFIADHDAMMTTFMEQEGDWGLGDLGRISSVAFYGLFGSVAYSDVINQYPDEVLRLSGLDRLSSLQDLDIDYQLLLPGMDKPLKYRLTGDRLLLAPYEISAYSSTVNLWTYVVTALVVLVALGSLFIRRKRGMEEKK